MVFPPTRRGTECRRMALPSLKSSVSSLSASGFPFSSSTFFRKLSGLFSWPGAHASNWESSRDAAMDSGTFQTSENLRLDATIRPRLSTTRIPALAESRAARRTPAKACALLFATQAMPAHAIGVNSSRPAISADTICIISHCCEPQEVDTAAFGPQLHIGHLVSEQ